MSSCKDCAFNIDSSCRRYPPTIQCTSSATSNASFPNVYSFDWCHEWRGIYPCPCAGTCKCKELKETLEPSAKIDDCPACGTSLNCAGCGEDIQNIAEQSALLKEKDAEIGRLRKALSFYAEGKHIERHESSCFVDAVPAGKAWYRYEGGQVAKKALEKKQ